MKGAGIAIALFEATAHTAVPATPAFRQPLTHPALHDPLLHDPLLRATHHLGYTLI